MKLTFCFADKDESVLQIDTMIFDGDGQAVLKSQNSKFAILYNISKKKLGMKIIFCMQINIKVFKSWNYYF